MYLVVSSYKAFLKLHGKELAARIVDSAKTSLTLVFLSSICQIPTFSTLKIASSIKNLLYSGVLVRKISAVE